MSDDQQPGGPVEPPPPPKLSTLAPRPVVLLVALAFSAAMIWHLQYDATHDGYEGSKITLAGFAFILIVLGYDVGKWFRGGS